jgi:hypothetical protein
MKVASMTDRAISQGLTPAVYPCCSEESGTMSSAVPNSEWQERNRNQKSENLGRLIKGAAVIVSRIPQSVLIRMHILVRHPDNETPVHMVPVKDDVTVLFDSV